MKGKKIFLYAVLVFTFLVTLASIIMYGVLAKHICTLTTPLGESDCPATVLNLCTRIFDLKVDLPVMQFHLYCPWYKKDVGIGEAALALALVFVFLVAFKKYLKSPIFLWARLLFGIVGFAMLVAAVLISWTDLFDGYPAPKIPGYTFNKGAHAANAVLVIASCVCVFGLTVREVKKLTKKVDFSKGKHVKVSKIEMTSP